MKFIKSYIKIPAKITNTTRRLKNEGAVFDLGRWITFCATDLGKLLNKILMSKLSVSVHILVGSRDRHIMRSSG